MSKKKQKKTKRDNIEAELSDDSSSSDERCVILFIKKKNTR